MDSDETESEPADKAHLHRPMNAFLLFCKQHRPVVRERHPSIENRAVTKILGEWWSNLEEEDKSPYTSLAHQYKEAFMKANPEFRWHKMPPGTADSVPPSNVKPSTPSPANGMVCSPAGLLSTSNSFSPSELATSQDASSSPNSSASAPKPFKKRYLASQQSTNSQEPPISPASSLSSAGVSPEQARACEALMELARNESCASRSSEGSERRASPSDTPPMQTLREAVWSKVAGTLLKQEEDKLVVPPKDCPMNLTNQCTIRGQQIIEHIIENILSIPMNGPLDPTSEPITFSVNNNQNERESLSSPARNNPSAPNTPNGDVGDSIKASIYESLKNDLLKGKVTPTLPTSTGRSSHLTTAVNNKSSHSSPTVSPTSARQKPSRKQQQESPASLSPPSGQDVLRLIGSGQLPINVGNSAITITKTPRVSINSSQAPNTNSSSTSFPANSSLAPSSPVSLSLTRTGPSKGFHQASFSLNGGVPVLLSPQAGLVLSSPTNLVLSTGGRQVPGDCVLLSPVQGGQQVLVPASQHQHLVTASQQQHLVLTGTKLVLTSPSTSQPSPPAPQPVASDPVNLSVSSRSGVIGVARQPVTEATLATTTSTTATKRPPPADTIGEERRSSRTGRGRRYQEFIEDISNTKKKRRSHRSGEEASEPEVEMEALPQDMVVSSPPVSSPPTATQHPAAASSTFQQHQPQHVHWKKMRTGSLHSSSSRDNTQSEPSPPLKHQPAALANQETPTANHPQFDLDAKMEKMAPLKFPETFGSGKGSTRSSSSLNKSNASSSCRGKPSNSSITSHPSSKAFDSSSRPNKKSR